MRTPAARLASIAFVLAALIAPGVPDSAAVAAEGARGRGSDQKPKLTVKASPTVALSPARVVATAEIKGGPNDYEEYYCATVEWDWGDDTVSENTYDCDPYEPGKSEMRRRFTSEHIYRTEGAYQIQFSLKKKDRTLAAARTNVQIRAGVGGDVR